MSNENNSNENPQNNQPAAPKMQQIAETSWSDYAIPALTHTIAFVAGIGVAFLADKFFGSSGE